jgi:type I restriction enzyme S subunit
MSVEKIVPEIRFKGFSGEWTSFTLGELGTVAMNKRIFKHQTAIAGEVPFFKIGTFGKQPDAFISKTLFDEYKNKYPYPATGDLLLSASGSIGRIVEYKGEEQYFQDSNIVWLKHDGRIDNAFLKVFYSVVKWSGLEGSTIKRLYNKNILDTEICTPERPEQTAIGSYFQKLDNLINQHQQKHDKLSNIKKAMLEKMFPKQGETIPEIRFKGFSREWQKDKLGQVYNFQYGEFNTNPSNGGQYPVYGANGIIGGYTRFNAQSSAVIGHMGEYAGSVLWAEGKHFVTYNGTIAKPKKSDFNPLFGYFSLVKMNLKKVCGGSGQPFLSYDALERLDFIFPAEPEQTAIGNYFQKLDNLINQHQQQITKLNNIKQACLSKMFV